MVKHTYWLWESVLSKEFCNLIINETDWSKKEMGKVNGRDTSDENIRVTDVVWVDPMLPIGCVAFTYINSANTQAGWNYDMTHLEQIQISRYKKLGHYIWHQDLGIPNENNMQRKLSISIQLNDPLQYKGGKLEFKNLLEKEQPNMKQGSIIVFPSFIEHRITPVTKGVRYSAVTWAGGPAFK